MSKHLPIRQITREEFQMILQAAQQQHRLSGEPIPSMGAENVSKVDSCLLTPFQTFGGIYLYRTFYRKAAMLFYQLIKSHPLQNGNKRMAILALNYFCLRNGKHLRLTSKEYYQLTKNTERTQNQAKTLRKLRLLIRDKSKQIIPLSGHRFRNFGKKQNLLPIRFICMQEKIWASFRERGG